MSSIEFVIFIGATVLCGIVFAAVGIWAFCRKTPMHFWAGSTIPEDAITDVKKYNRANGFMWIVYAFLSLMPGIIVFFNEKLGIILMTLLYTVGFGLVICVYLLIKRHFSTKPNLD